MTKKNLWSFRATLRTLYITIQYKYGIENLHFTLVSALIYVTKTDKLQAIPECLLLQADCGTSDPSSSPGSVRPSIHRPKMNRPARHALRLETTRSSIESSSVLLDNPNDDLKETINNTNNYTKDSNLSPEYCSRPRRVKVTISKIKSGLNGQTSLKVEHVTDICARNSLNNIWQNFEILLLKRQIGKGNQCLTSFVENLHSNLFFVLQKLYKTL